MKVGRVSVFILLAGLLLSACSHTSSPVSPIGDFPLSKGTTWTYSVSEYQPAGQDPTKTITAESIYTDTVVDTQTAGAFFIAHVQRSTRLVRWDPGWSSAPDSGVPEWWYVIEGQKVYESRQPLDVKNIQTEALLLDLDFPLDPGKSWCSSTTIKGEQVLDCSSPGAGKVTVEKLEGVTSTAGNFKNCVLVIQWSNGGNVIQQFCSGVGFVNVKFDHSGTPFGFERTLTDYTKGTEK